MVRLLTPEEITKEKLQILGPEGGSVILVILHSKEQYEACYSLQVAFLLIYATLS